MTAKARQRSASGFGVNVDGREFANIPVSRIKTGRNVRNEFREDSLNGLVESIRVNGILEPLIVMHGKSGEFELIAGERRYKAAEILELPEIPCLIYPELNEQQLYEIMLSENLLRDDLNPVEEAIGIRKMLDLGMSQEDLASRMGRSQPYVANRLRLLEGPDILRDMIISREITPSHAMVMLPWTPYPVFDSFIEKYREFNGDHRRDHGDAIIPVKEIPNKFHAFRDFCLQGAKKTNLTLDIDSSFGEHGDDIRKNCNDCQKSMKIGFSYKKFCLDAECIKETRKKAREHSAAMRGRPAGGKNEGEDRSGWTQFRHDSWNSDTYPLKPSDCDCGRKAKDAYGVYCKDAECFRNKNTEKVNRIRNRSDELRALAEREIVEFCRTAEKDELTDLLIHWAYTKNALYQDNAGDDGPSVRLFGEYKPIRTSEEAMRMIVFMYLRDIPKLDREQMIVTDAAVKEMILFIDGSGTLSPQSMRDMLLKKKASKKTKASDEPEMSETSEGA